MREIRAFQYSDLSQLTQLINLHITMLIPSWGLPSSIILSHLDDNPEQPVLNPWVFERKTLCAFVGEQLVAAAHLLHYGNEPTIFKDYRDLGDIAWFVFEPEFMPEARDLLAACHQQMRDWKVRKLIAWDSGLSIPCATGISDKWPHLRELFLEAGYKPNLGHQEAVFGGTFDKIVPPPQLPLSDGLWIYQQIADPIVLTISKGIEMIGRCEADSDLTSRGQKPALQSWAELNHLEVKETWRRRGIATLLIQKLVEILKKEGKQQIVFAVMLEDEIVGAGAFYASLGWNLISRGLDGLTLESWSLEETSHDS
jgi:GNAT superfamily N-acetyltransferase